MTKIMIQDQLSPSLIPDSKFQIQRFDTPELPLDILENEEAREQLHNGRSPPDREWMKISVATPDGTNTPLYIGPDKSPKQLKVRGNSSASSKFAKTPSPIHPNHSWPTNASFSLLVVAWTLDVSLYAHKTAPLQLDGTPISYINTNSMGPRSAAHFVKLCCRQVVPSHHRRLVRRARVKL